MNCIARHGLHWILRTAAQLLLATIVATSALLLLPAAQAQLYTGSIAGTVKDSAGAFLANAQIKATDAEKGFEFSATSDSAGRYVIRELPPSNYTVTA
ncbi:MAG TPA: carboxypeptidase-like regulatory domain-containing protein, partial [Terriglobales bacterium]|nr:carboxypeptidase-like regulatory domain-containing protein [Terriglobales bacterium]